MGAGSVLKQRLERARPKPPTIINLLFQHKGVTVPHNLGVDLMKFFSVVLAALLILSGCTTGQPPGSDSVGGGPNGHQTFITPQYLPGSGAVTDHGLSGLYTRVVVSTVNNQTNEPFLSAAYEPGEGQDQRDLTSGVPSICLSDPRAADAPTETVEQCARELTGAAGPSGRNYASETRHFWQRWLLGRVNTKTALLHINVSTPDISTTSTLAAFTHESTRANGEQFSTEIRHHSVATPFFRIEPDATVDLRLEFSLGYTTSSDTIAATLSTATAALGVLGPSSQLLTSLNREEVNQASQFFDTTISAVLSEDLTEIVRVTNGIEDWLQGQRAEFTIAVPDHQARRLAEIDTNNTDTVGAWRVELDLPRVSIWSEYSPCWRISRTTVCPETPITLAERAAALENALMYLTPSQVLQFKVTDTTTLGAHIRDQSWYTSSVSAINSASANDGGVQTASFCRQVMRTATETGFNTLDAHIILWAVLGSAEVSPNARTLAYAGGCSQEKAIIDALEL